MNYFELKYLRWITKLKTIHCTEFEIRLHLLVKLQYLGLRNMEYLLIAITE